MILTVALIIIILFVIVYQDFRFLSISWWTIPALIILATYSGVMQIGAKQLVITTAINLGFVLLQVIVLTLYFSIKKKHLVKITQQYLGIGDILFFIFLTICFEPLHFVLFFVMSLLVVIIVFFLLKSIQVYKKQHIPLAGAMGFLYVLFLFLISINNYNPYLVNGLQFLLL